MNINIRIVHNQNKLILWCNSIELNHLIILLLIIEAKLQQEKSKNQNLKCKIVQQKRNNSTMVKVIIVGLCIQIHKSIKPSILNKLII